MPVVIDRNSLPSPVGTRLSDMSNVGEASGPLASPAPKVPASLLWLPREKVSLLNAMFFIESLTTKNMVPRRNGSHSFPTAY